MKFKVFDSKLKRFLSAEFYFLDCNGNLHYLDSNEVCSEWIFPVFSSGKKDKDGTELFDGDYAIDDHYKETCEIHYSNDSGCWFFGDILLSDQVFDIEKTGSKFEKT